MSAMIATDTQYRTEQQFDDLLRECAEVTAEQDRLRNENVVLQGLAITLTETLKERPGLLEERTDLMRLFSSDSQLELTVSEHREALRAIRRWKVSAKILAIAWCVALVYEFMRWWSGK